MHVLFESLGAQPCRFSAAQRVVSWLQFQQGQWLRSYITDPFPKIMGRLEEARVDYAMVSADKHT